MGSSIYHTGIQTRKWGQSQELTKLTEAMYNARELAMTRMEEEALELGADGVVGVRLDVNYYEWGKDAAEFIAVGTAVKAESGVSHRNKLGKPFTSDLSGQDFWTLMQTGHIPQGLVMGTCVYHIAHRGLGATLGSAGQNVELPNFTQALYEARELAMTRMQDEANELGRLRHRRGPTRGEVPPVGQPHHRVPLPRDRGGQDLRRGHAPPADHHHLPRQLMTQPAEESGALPEAAVRRMADGAFTSGLTVPDFAACLQMGLEPVGFAQGYCVMQWQFYGMSPFGIGGFGGQTAIRGYSENFGCPHGMVSAEHRAWGQNYEQAWVQDAWTTGFTTAYGRMVEEAAAAGAHGIVGVVDSSGPLADMGVVEFRIQGTAVRVAGGEPPADGRPWTTYLAGQRLTKLVEAGYAPVSIAASVASVRQWANCVTQYLTEGTRSMYGGLTQGAEIIQTVRPRPRPGKLATERVRRQLGRDSLHGASLSTVQRSLGEGDAEIECVLRGNRVRRFKEFDPLPPPRPTVRLL